MLTFKCESCKKKITTDDSRCVARVVAANEELILARHTRALLGA